MAPNEKEISHDRMSWLHQTFRSLCHRLVRAVTLVPQKAVKRFNRSHSVRHPQEMQADDSECLGQSDSRRFAELRRFAAITWDEKLTTLGVLKMRLTTNFGLRTWSPSPCFCVSQRFASPQLR